MIISDWDRDLILRCLNNYRVANARGKNLQSLDIFLTHLLMSGLTNQGYPEDGNADFKEEALRRFVKGKSRLEDDKVFAIQQFLIHKKFLKEEELGGDIDPDYLPGLLAVQDYLGNKSKKAISYIAKIEKTYHARIVQLGAEKEIQLNIILKHSDPFFRVEEIFGTKKNTKPSHSLYKKDNDKISQPMLRGYGFVSTQYHIIYMFLQEKSGDHTITYVQTEIPHSDYQGTKVLTFMRTGERVNVFSRLKGEDLPIILNNVFEFSADPDMVMVNTERLSY